jgi:hypothetical protein
MEMSPKNTNPFIKIDKELEPYYKAHKSSIDRRNAQIKKELAEKNALADQCEQEATALYKQLMEVLPEEHHKLLSSFSLMKSAARDLRVTSIGKQMIDLYQWALKESQKLRRRKPQRAKKST